MPTPRKGERKKKFIKRCIPDLFKEEGTLTSKDKKSKQAYAICNSTFDRRKKKKNENILFFDEFINENFKDVDPFGEDDWEEREVVLRNIEWRDKNENYYGMIKQAWIGDILIGEIIPIETNQILKRNRKLYYNAQFGVVYPKSKKLQFLYRVSNVENEKIAMEVISEYWNDFIGEISV